MVGLKYRRIKEPGGARSQAMIKLPGRPPRQSQPVRNAGAGLNRRELVRLVETSNRSSADAPALTKREMDVLYLVAWGMNAPEMAEALAISPRTVEIHRCNLLKKLGARNSADAVRIALTSPLRAFICGEPEGC